MIRKILLGTVAGLAIAGAALAQVNTVPSVGLITGVLKKPSYSAVTLALPPAASATDIACIAGSAQQACINLNAVSISSGLVHISIDWTEE